MRKVLSIILSIMMLCSVFTGLGITANGAQISESGTAAVSGYYEYKVLEDGTAEITNYTGNYTELVIPSKLDEYVVTSIGYRSFDDCIGITSLTIPGTVTNIGDYAFRNCQKLSYIKIPANVTKIGDWAFMDCTGLANISISDSDMHIGREAFVNTKYFNESANWENDVLYIDNYLIKAKDTLSGEYAIKAGTKRTASHAFFNCQGLTAVTIPDSMITIGVSAFGSCIKLENVVIPEGVTGIGDYAFDFCTGLKSVTIPDTVTSIGNFAFEYCTSLTDVTIPDSVTSIGTSAFEGCSALTRLYIGKGITNIAPTNFNKCFNLNTLIIADGVKSIGKSAFSGFSKLRHVHFLGTEEQWTEIEIGTGNEYFSSASRYYLKDLVETKVEPTCGEKGHSTFSCDICKYSYTVEYDALGHTLVVDEAVAATCTETGLTEGNHCATCNIVFVEQEVIPATGHTEVIDEAYDSTCKETGRTQGSHCSVCNEVLVEQEIIETKSHVWQHWQVLTQRLRCRDGVLIRVCDICSDYECKVIKAEGNHIKAEKTVGVKKATYFAKGYTGDVVCRTCNEVITEGKEVAKLKLKTPVVKYTGGKKKLTVKYTKVSGATGFQVKYTLGKKSVTKTFNTKKSVNKTISNLKKGTYKVQVRAFVKQGTKTAYSSWTKAASVKVK